MIIAFANYSYDVFGRLVKEVRPGDSFTYPTLEVEYVFDGVAPEKIVEKRLEENVSGGTLDAYYFYDGFGNLVQHRREAEGKDIVTDFVYDGLSRVENQSNPYYANSNDSYLTPNGSFFTIYGT